jgi:creatine kinase/arginine kinase
MTTSFSSKYINYSILVLTIYFLNREGDRFLKACNLNRDWPSGRGIFHNEAKSFLVWVNEED